MHPSLYNYRPLCTLLFLGNPTKLYYVYVYLCTTRFSEKEEQENQDHLWKWSRLNYLWWSTSNPKKKNNNNNKKPDFVCGVRNLWLFHFLLLTKISLSWFYGIWCAIHFFDGIDKSTLICFNVFGTTVKLSCSDYFCCFFQKNAYPVLNLKFMSFHTLIMFFWILLFACFLVIMLVRNYRTGSFVVRIKA